MSYAEKLKDPRWQKKRLKILERDNWTCQICHSTRKMLTVHHTYYDIRLDPWDYPDYSLKTLCESCHDIEQKKVDSWLASTNKLLYDLPMLSNNYTRIYKILSEPTLIPDLISLYRDEGKWEETLHYLREKANEE